MVGTAAPFVRIGLAGGQGLALAIPDVTPPTAVSFSPADNATGVIITTNLVATMSEVVVLGASGLISLKLTSDNSTIQTWNVATQAGTGAGQVSVVGGTNLTMRLTAALANSIEYYVIWDAGVVQDTSANPIAAQASTTLWSFTTVAGASGTYLLDLYPTASMAYSFRKLRNAYAGSAVRIRRSSDNLELNIGFDGSGNFDTAAAAAHIGGGSGFIVTWFDQSGNAIDVTNATVSGQPAYSATGLNSLPAAVYDGTDNLGSVAIPFTGLPALTTTTMSILNGNGGHLGWSAGTDRFMLNPIAAGTMIYWDFGSVASGRVNVAPPAGWATGGHLLETGREAAGNFQYITVDGVELIRSARTGLMAAGSATFNVGLAPGADFHTGPISEVVIWAADLAANRTAARGNIQTYWLPAASTLLLDVLGVSATRAYSTRKLRSAYAGSAIRIRRSSDNAEQDIGFVGENLDTAAVSTFVGANSAYVVKWYDQSGSADDCVQATVSLQARIVNAGTLDVRNTKACPLFDGVDDTYVTTAFPTAKSAGAVAAINAAGPNFPSYNCVVGATTTAAGFIQGNSGLPNYLTSGMGTPIVNNSGSAGVFGGVLQQLEAHGIGITNTEPMVISGDRGMGIRNWPGWIGEVVTFNPALSAGNTTAMYTNQKTYWGTP